MSGTANISTVKMLGSLEARTRPQLTHYNSKIREGAEFKNPPNFLGQVSLSMD